MTLLDDHPNNSLSNDNDDASRGRTTSTSIVAVVVPPTIAATSNSIHNNTDTTTSTSRTTPSLLEIRTTGTAGNHTDTNNHVEKNTDGCDERRNSITSRAGHDVVDDDDDDDGADATPWLVRPDDTVPTTGNTTSSSHSERTAAAIPNNHNNHHHVRQCRNSHCCSLSSCGCCCCHQNNNTTTNVVRILFPWAYNNNDNENGIVTTSSSTSSLAMNLTTHHHHHHQDHHYKNDSPVAVAVGIATLIIIGCTIGILSYLTTSSSSSSLSTRDVVVSSCIGYTYMIMWSVSFYPQCALNLQRRTCTGLSVDFCWYNFIGFICYTTYNVSLYYNKTVQHQYHQRHNDGNKNSSTATIPIQSNDVAFAIHALILCTILLGQVGYYDGISALRPSRRSCYILTIILLGMLMYPIVLLMVVPMIISSTSPQKFQMLDYIYFLSYIKVGITCMKYVPQVYYNYRRRSTVGWNIWQILLDLSGGICSTVQLIYDAPSTATTKDIFFRNLPKFMLGNISILFDIIFIGQHYFLYPTATTTASIREEPSSLMRLQNMDEHQNPITYQLLSTYNDEIS